MVGGREFCDMHRLFVRVEGPENSPGIDDKYLE